MQTSSNVQAPRNAAPPRASRMTLANVKRGKLRVPRKDLLYGPEKIGKSTWASGAPSPIFLCAEDRTSHLDIERFPEPQCWEDAFDAVTTLAVDRHEYRTFVVDTLDWLEPFVWSYVCRKSGNVDSIEKVGGGYGKGYVAALDEWRRFLGACERLVKGRDMALIFLAHAHVKTWKNPAGADFDRYCMKLNEKAAGLVKEWCDNVLFVNYETYTTDGTGGDGRKAKGVLGARVIYTERSAAWEAGNSFSLPEKLPFAWDDVDAACTTRTPTDISEIQREITELAGRLVAAPADLFNRAGFAAALAAAGTDASALAILANRLRGKVAQFETSAAAAAPASAAPQAAAEMTATTTTVNNETRGA